MKTRILLTMALVAGMMLAGCSKSEDNMEENNESVKNEQLVSIIRQHIVGTWEHSGSCKSNAPLTPYDDIILRDVLTFEESEKDMVNFTADGKMRITKYKGEEELSDEGFWKITGLLSTDDADIHPPYGIDLQFIGTSMFAVSHGEFSRILFSGNFAEMYLQEHNSKIIYRYIRQ